MGRPKLPPGQAREFYSRVRLNRTEQRSINKAAKISGEEPAVFLRNQGLDAARVIIDRDKKRKRT